MLASKPQLAAQDLKAGDRVAEREITLDMAAFLQFSTLTGDRHPIHYDPGYAIDKGFRGPLAHGLLLLAMSALGATDLSEKLHDSMVAMAGAQAKFLRPVIAGDRLRLDYTVAGVRPHSEDLSLVCFDVTVYPIDSRQLPENKPACVFSLEFLLKNRTGLSHASEH